MRRITVLVATVSVFASPVSAAVRTAAPATPLSMEIGKRAVLLRDDSVLLEVTATCPDGAVPLEAFVYVVQDDADSEFGFPSIVCDGNPHRSSVRVLPLDGVFHKGKAQASGYLLLESGENVSAGRRVHIRPAKR